MDAVVLAGAPNTGRLREVSPAPYEALIEIAGRPMVTYVLDALQGSGQVGRLVVVGPQELDPVVALYRRAERIAPGPDVMANVRAGIEHLGSMNRTDPILVSTSDIPLLTPEAVDDFLTRCRQMGELDVYYPVVLRERSEAAYPGVERTYMRLKDGVVTGGNLFLLRGDVIDRCGTFLEEAVTLRKNPLRMSRLLGPRVIVKLAVNRLSTDDVARRIYDMLGLKGRAVFTPYAEIGVDVDKPSDLELARTALAAGPVSTGRS
ncbi:NTP transferase domain-containing protein [Limnochorda pilosa]|uniref:NTP transferase domain-containing protein n=1 Tax=Limnochorda pilosa TaxID=1555112 RepID=UPI00130E977D|nr:NTP transferase domain-containing protein [Limnochorda pilosa]